MKYLLKSTTSVFELIAPVSDPSKPLSVIGNITCYSCFVLRIIHFKLMGLIISFNGHLSLLSKSLVTFVTFSFHLIYVKCDFR